ncbi:hypothetical protein EDB86DRAFT_3245840 [Lactarius hatsudake]|nr:hypothetical protein EDB86DRAFT_3245840 [Lactarius hatsudake]
MNPNTRSSMGPAARPSAAAVQGFSLASPRPGGGSPSGRPTSELLGSATFQTPDADTIDQWFENFHHYEVTLEEMAATSLDVSFKEELSAIEQWFKVLSEAERTAAHYSLSQHSTQVQLRFFITVVRASQPLSANPPTIEHFGLIANRHQLVAVDLFLLASFPPLFRLPIISSHPRRSFLWPYMITFPILTLTLDHPLLLKRPLVRDVVKGPASEHLSLLTRALSSTYTVLQQMARADPMTALLSPAVGGSMQSQMEAKLASMNLKSLRLQFTMPGSPPPAPSMPAPRIANHSRSTPLLLSSLQIPPIPLAAQATPRPHSPNSALNPKSSRPQSTDFSGLSAGSAFRSPRADGSTAPGGLDGLSPAVGDSWANMVNTPLLPIFQKTSSNNSNDGQAVDLAVAKLNDLYGSSNVPRLDGPEKFRRPSKGHIHDGSSGSNNGVTNNGVYGDDGDLIRGHHARGVGRVQSSSSRGLRNGGGGTWSGEQSPALSNSSGRFGGSDDESNAMAAAHQQRQAALAGLGMGVGGFNLGLGSPGLTGMPNGLNMAQLAQLKGMNGMNPFNMNMHEHAEPGRDGGIAAAGGGFGQPGLGVGADLGTFGGMQGGMSSNGLRGGSGRSGGRSPGLGGSGSGSGRGGSAGNGGAKKDEEDFEPSVLNDGMTWKEMVVMDEQALEAQGVAALGARRKLLKTFEMVRKKMGIDDPTAPPPPPSGGSAPGAPGSSGGSAGSGGGLSA